MMDARSVHTLCQAGFLAALAYISRDDVAPAQRFRDRGERVPRRLEAFAGSGRSLPEFPSLPHREVLARPDRFFCRVKGKTVWIIAVWYGAQEAERPGE
jgi:plasmid stabilization system protein ParE